MEPTPWLADDPELLRAALEIIETWDDGDALESVTVASLSSDATDSPHDGEEDSGDDGSLVVTMRLPPWEAKPVQTIKQAAPRGLKPSTVASTRHRRREEIIFLRDKVKEMETQLAALEKAKRDQERREGEMSENDQAMTVMWHDMANRQQRLRQKSELDQAKLKKLLETQMKVAQGLMKLMQKARRIEEDEAFPKPKRHKIAGGVPILLSEEDQIERVEVMYRNIDAAFTFPKFHDGTMKFVDIKVIDEHEEEVIIEFREAWTVPFDVDCVLDALWEYTLKKNNEKWNRPGLSAESRITSEGNALVSRFAASTTLGGLTANYDGQIVVKRFLGGSGGDQPSAIITSMKAEPNPTRPGDMDGMHMEDDSWIRVRPFESHRDEVRSSHVTQVQCSQRFHMQIDENVANAKEAAGAITTMLLDKLKEDMELKHDTVETLLLRSRAR